jgi:hypothetical protein
MISKSQEINTSNYRESKTSVRVAGYSSESNYARVNSKFFNKEEGKYLSSSWPYSRA